jgi:hypothetical protein
MQYEPSPAMGTMSIPVGHTQTPLLQVLPVQSLPSTQF